MQNFQDIVFIWTQTEGYFQICISVPLGDLSELIEVYLLESH